jgi:metallo-beta-lactamase family protein
MSEKVKIRFLGAAGTVTGSKHLISALGKNILIDCGMFQGLKKLRLLNWEELPVNVSGIDKILLTHGHYDHCGYLPRLVKSGFHGEIMATVPTLQVAETILTDSAKIQEEDAEKANREGYSKHKPAEPFYTSEDVEGTIKLFSVEPEGEWINLYEGIRARFNYVGHILGATFIELEIAGKRFVFSGDIGRENDVLMNPPKKPDYADYIFIESTYGDKIHPEDTDDKFIEIINETIRNHGTVIIPSFAVERTQSVMYLLWKFQEQGLIPQIPIYMDSPMGTNILEIFQKNIGWHKLSSDDCIEMSEKIKIISTMKNTFKLAADKSSKIIIAGSGMAAGGRVLTYLQNYLGEKNSTILMVGYQAEATRGRQLLDGVKELKIHGKYYPVRARIEIIQGLSAHADQPGLLNWLSDIKNTPDKVFIVHGEQQPADVLRLKIKDTYGWECVIPSLYEEFEV